MLVAVGSTRSDIKLMVLLSVVRLEDLFRSSNWLWGDFCSGCSCDHCSHLTSYCSRSSMASLPYGCDACSSSQWALWNCVYAPSWSLHSTTTCLRRAIYDLKRAPRSWFWVFSVCGVADNVLMRVLMNNLSLSGLFPEIVFIYLVRCRWHDHYWWWWGGVSSLETHLQRYLR